MVLDGVDLKLISIKVNGKELKVYHLLYLSQSRFGAIITQSGSEAIMFNMFILYSQEGDYYLDSRHLTVPSPPSGKFTLEIDTEIQPQKNTSLEVEHYYYFRSIMYNLFALITML